MRIERLWGDTNSQVSFTWKIVFRSLEVHHGLDINNHNHLWLIHFLFLPLINEQLKLFAEGWNNHKIQVRDGPNRSPMDYWVFDTVVHGVRGEELDMEDLEDIELYGVDWDALDDGALLESRERNNPSDEAGSSSYNDQIPDNLNQVPVDTPSGVLNEVQVAALESFVSPWLMQGASLTGQESDERLIGMWTGCLLFCRSMKPEWF